MFNNLNSKKREPMKIGIFTWRTYQGKSSICLNLHMGLPKSIVITNEKDQQTPLKGIVDKKRLLILKKDELVPWNKIPDNWDILVDLAGLIEENRVRDVLEKVDKVICPIRWDNNNTLFKQSMSCLKSIKKYNSNVIVVINNTETKYIPAVKRQIQKSFPDTPIFILNSSTAIPRSMDENKSLKELASIPRFSYAYGPVANQFDELFKFVTSS